MRSYSHRYSPPFISSDHFFGALLNEEIGFYNGDIKCKPVFEFKLDAGPITNLDRFFDSDEHIEEYFDSEEEESEHDELLDFDDFL